MALNEKTPKEHMQEKLNNHVSVKVVNSTLKSVQEVCQTPQVVHVEKTHEDQVLQIEQTRDVVCKINPIYGEVIPKPEPLVISFARFIGKVGNANMINSLGHWLYF